MSSQNGQVSERYRSGRCLMRPEATLYRTVINEQADAERTFQ